MGIWDRITGQAGAQWLDVVDWVDDSNDTIVYRFPIHDRAITDNSKLIVREGQAGVFVAEGQLSDVFGPGTYTLHTPNSPIMSFFNTIAYSFNNPYKGDFLFVSTRQFMDNGWGTQNPFMMRDAEFGPIRVRAFGSYSFRVTDPATFIRQIVGTDGLFTTDEITGQLKKRLVSNLAAAIGQAKIPVLDLVSNQLILGDRVRDQLNPGFQEAYGVTLTDVTVGNISLPKEVEEALDSRSKMGILGNLNAYTQMQAADAMGDAARNPGMAGAGMGMGMGMGMGQVMSQAMSGAAGGQAAPAAPPPLPGATRYHYNGPAGQAQLTADEVASRIASNRDAQHLVWTTGWAAWKDWSDVADIAGKVPPAMTAPPPLPSAPPPPPAPPAPTEVEFQYNGPAGGGSKTLSEVVAIVKADPDGAHNLWQAGWDGWKAAGEVEAVAAALAE